MDKWRDIARFLGRTLMVAATLTPFLALYLWLDPFKVIWHYDEYYPARVKNRIELNSGYLSVANYDNHRQQARYDSFIFGDSRAFYFLTDDWRRYLPPGSSPYHFDGAAESLLAIERKVRYADSHGSRLRDVLLVLDYETLSQTESSSTPYLRLPPKLSSPVGAVTFHLSQFGQFMNPTIMRIAVDCSLHGDTKEYKSHYHLVTPHKYTFDSERNEYYYYEYEEQIEAGTYYTPSRMKMFENAQHPDSVAPRAIRGKQTRLLKSIKEVFDRHGTRCKVVISPTYNQIRLNPADVEALRELFGPDNVADFSGVNRWTSDYRYYYEQQHFRYCLSREILELVYGPGRETPAEGL